MAEKKITRKVISRFSTKETNEKTTETQSQKTSPEAEKQGASPAKKTCFFCQSKTDPSYTDINLLRRFTTDRAKIVPRAKSNLCSKHQRAMTKHIKYARHLALLPFTPKV